MVDVNKAVVARLKKGKHIAEILVDCENALKYKQGLLSSLDDVLATEDVYSDVKKGKHAMESELLSMFGTKDKMKVFPIILKEGEITLTTEYKNKLREEKRKLIISLISRNAVDPKTNLPHPFTRIEKAIQDAGVIINEHKSAEDQVNDVVKKIREKLPLRYETREVLLMIPAEYAGQCYAITKRQSIILKEEWKTNGELYLTVEIPAGLQTTLFDALNGVAHGHVEYKLVKTK